MNKKKHNKQQQQQQTHFSVVFFFSLGNDSFSSVCRMDVVLCDSKALKRICTHKNVFSFPLALVFLSSFTVLLLRVCQCNVYLRVVLSFF